ncbi:MAG: hypothetical protein ACI8RD_006916 [Bacillariaceae sp.]
MRDRTLQDKVHMKQNNYWNCYNAGVKKKKDDNIKLEPKEIKVQQIYTKSMNDIRDNITEKLHLLWMERYSKKIENFMDG